MQPSSRKFCRYCGSSLESQDAIFCQNCGHPINSRSNLESSPPPSSSANPRAHQSSAHDPQRNVGNKVAAMIIIVLIIFGFLVGIGTFNLGRQSVINEIARGLTNPSVSTTSITSSNSSSNTPSHSVSTSGVAITTSTTTTSASSSFNPSGLIASMNEMIGNFSQMTINEYLPLNGSTFNMTYSYQVLQHNASQTVVRFNINGVSVGIPQNKSAEVTLNGQGNITQVTENGFTYTGSEAQITGSAFTPTFQALFSFASEYPQYAPFLNSVGSSSYKTFGSAQLNVITFNDTQDNTTIQIGNIPNTQIYLLTDFAVQNYIVQVVSLTRA